MITLAQRIEALRTERGLSRPALSQALGFPKNAAEKFETGRQTPTREQQEKMAAFFGVSLFYLRGESNDRTRQETLSLIHILLTALHTAKTMRHPTAILMRTVKGKGVSFMEDDSVWHGSAPDDEQMVKAIAEIKEGGVV